MKAFFTILCVLLFFNVSAQEKLDTNGISKITITMARDGKLIKGPGSLYETIGSVKNGEEVSIIDYVNGYWLLMYNDELCFINDALLPRSELITKLRNNPIDSNIEFRKKYIDDLNNIENKRKEAEIDADRLSLKEILKADKDKRNLYDRIDSLRTESYRHRGAFQKAKYAEILIERKALLIKLYGEEEGNLIANQSYWKGMTPSQAIQSLGKPLDINRTVGEWGRHEQWVYDGKYLYFENGILTSYQY